MNDEVEALLLGQNYADKQIQKAVENMVNSWSLDYLHQFAIEELVDHYLENADDIELDILIENHGHL